MNKYSVKNNTFILGCILFFAAFLRFYNLSGKSLWQDEQWTLIISRNSIAGLIDYLKIMADRPPLHLFLTHFIIFFSKSEFFLRLIPAIFGIGCIVLIYFMGKLFFSEKEGIISAFLLTISSFHLNYSQEATTYTIFLFFSLLTIIMFFLSTKYDKWIIWASYIIFSVLNLYSSYFSIFLIAATILTMSTLWLTTLFLKKTEHVTNESNQTNEHIIFITNRKFLTFIFCNILIATSYIPWMPVFFSSFSRYKGDIYSTWIELSPLIFIKILKEFNGNDYILTSILSVFFIKGFAVSFKNYIKESIIFFWYIITPFLIIFLLKPKYNFFPRYVIFILPIYLVIISKGITSINGNINKKLKLKSNQILVVLIIIISIPSFLSLYRYYGTERRNWRSTAKFMEKETSSGDIIAIDPSFLYYPFFYYLDINWNKKINLIDPLNPAPLVHINLKKTKNIAVCRFLTLKNNPNKLKNYNRLWYIVSSKKVPKWIKKNFTFIKRINGFSKEWDIFIYNINVNKLKHYG